MFSVNSLTLTERLASRLGLFGGAEEAFAEFEKGARNEMAGADNANPDLISYDGNEGANPKEALKIAEIEVSRRQDVFTRAAYAWAL